MCGLIGFVESNQGKFNHTRLATGLSLMEHRGPDDHGEYETNLGAWKIGLGHTRLAILDLSKAGHQPMVSKCGHFALVFNGEIYNYRELRTILKYKGYDFLSDSDTEVLLAAWSHWGISCLDQLVGMFAFVVFDRTKSTVFCVRDAFGIKPFYYKIDNHLFQFASELGPLNAMSNANPRLDAEKSYQFLVHNDYDHGTRTFFENCQRLEPGHVLKVQLNRTLVFEKLRWWKPSIEERHDLSFSQSADDVRSLFLENIRLHLRSDVPVGFALSGGIDSSAIVCAVRHIEPSMPIHTFTFIGDVPGKNEERWAEVINQSVDGISHKIKVEPSDIVADLDDLITCQGEPFPTTSIYAQFRVFKEARSKGMIVTLDGQGADELFAGYDGYPFFRLKSLEDEFKEFTAFQGWKVGFSKEYPNKGILGRIKRVFPPRLNKIIKNLVSGTGQPNWLRPGNLSLNPTSYGKGEYFRDNQSGRRLVSRLRDELTDISLQALLRYEDRNSMRWSLESRVPFLTTRLAEYVLRLPEDFLVSRRGLTKSVLRAALRGIVPDKILDRRDKVGFETPDFSWLQGFANRFNPWVDSLSNCDFINVEKYRKTIQCSLSRKDTNPWQVWRMICFARWHSLNFN